MTSKTFSDFKLKPYLVKAVTAINFHEPTAVQEKVIPDILAGKSVVGQSATCRSFPGSTRLFRKFRRSSRPRAGSWPTKFTMLPSS